MGMVWKVEYFAHSTCMHRMLECHIWDTTYLVLFSSPKLFPFHCQTILLWSQYELKCMWRWCNIDLYCCVGGLLGRPSLSGSPRAANRIMFRTMSFSGGERKWLLGYTYYHASLQGSVVHVLLCNIASVHHLLRRCWAIPDRLGWSLCLGFGTSCPVAGQDWGWGSGEKRGNSCTCNMYWKEELYKHTVHEFGWNTTLCMRMHIQGVQCSRELLVARHTYINVKQLIHILIVKCTCTYTCT